MGNRFNGNRVSMRLPVNEDPAAKAAEALHVKEITEAEFDAQVVAEPLPVALEFFGKDSKACEALGPRFAAVAEKFAGKVRFLKISRSDSAALAARLGVTTAPTIVFLRRGEAKGERLSGDDIKRPELKARVEALLGIVRPPPTPAAVK
jgi:thioredoxin-like negative regulator of GroEL